MWKEEYKRLFLNFKTIIIIGVLVILGCMSFYYSWQFRAGFLEMKASLPADVDSVNLNIFLDYYKGLKFNINFFLTSDYIQFYLIVLLLFTGIFLSGELHKLINTGQENFILSRLQYKKHIKNLMIAQSMYIASIVFISALIIVLIGYILGGFGGDAIPIGLYLITNRIGLLLILAQMIVILLYVILANAISLFSNIFVKDKLVIQCFPFILFYLVPSVIVPNICNFFGIDYFLIHYFLPSTMLLGIDNILQSDAYFTLIKFYLLPILLYFLAFIVIYFWNRTKLGKNTL